MTTDVVIIGAGGFGRETLEVARSSIRDGGELRVVAVVDDDPNAQGVGTFEREGVPYIGDLDSYLQGMIKSEYILAVGDPHRRLAMASRLEGAGFRAATVVHASAVIGARTTIGAGSVICGGVQVSNDVVIGEHCHINPNATIGHDATLERAVSINPSAVISGFVRVGEGALVGAGAVVLQGLEIGANAVVGAAACVTRSVESGVIVKGIPAR